MQDPAAETTSEEEPGVAVLATAATATASPASQSGKGTLTHLLDPRHQPKEHKVKILIWSDLTLDDVYKLDRCNSYEDVRLTLADIFHLNSDGQDHKAEITLDLFFYTLQFARKECYSPEKTSVVFSIIKKIFERCTETPYGNLQETFQYFRDLLLCHTVHQPPDSLELFSAKEAIGLTTFTLNTFFRHFKLYKFAFTPSVRLDITFKYIGRSPSPQPAEEVTEAGSQDETDVLTEGADNLEAEDVDEERLKAQEELRKIVTDLLLKEVKKIEGNIDRHLKTAVEALSAKIDPLIESTVKTPRGKKR